VCEQQGVLVCSRGVDADERGKQFVGLVGERGERAFKKKAEFGEACGCETKACFERVECVRQRGSKNSWESQRCDKEEIFESSVDLWKSVKDFV